MKASELRFQQLLDGKPQYRVPLFQRTYNWGEEEWERLWDDVLKVYAMEEHRNHFIGAVVTQPVDDSAGQVTKYLVIDGQQRLITLFVMLACIRNKAMQTSELSSLCEEIWDTCLVNKFAPATEDFLKLRPTQRDREDFETVINGQATNGNGKVVTAFKYFARKIDDGDLEGVPLDLRELKFCITDRLDLVSITLQTEDSPHRIFESLNNTGMHLGPSDLIRNLIFMNIPGEATSQAAYAQHWFPMQEATRDRLDDFFWRYIMMDGSLPRIGETFEVVKKRFEHDGAPAVETLKQFSQFAKHYRRLCGLEEDGRYGPLLQEIKRLNTWEVSVAYPFLMRSYHWVDEGKVGLQDLLAVMKMIESFVVRRAVCAVPTNRLRSIFARMSAQVNDAEFVASSRNYLLKESWPSDEEFKKRFVGYGLYYSARLARTQLVLRSLEDSFEHREAPEITEDITIEHIMPQALTDDWKEMLGPGWGEIQAQWLHTPGNLTLTAYNAELGNASFADKKRFYADSKFSLTRDVISCERWDEKAIEARGAALAERAIQLWRKEPGI